MANPNELQGWEEIASHLGVAARTAQKYERVYGLPVRRMPGQKGRVFSVIAEVEEWRRGFEAAQAEAEPGVTGGIGSAPPRSQSPGSGTTQRKYIAAARRSRWHIMAGIAIASILTTPLVLHLIRRRPAMPAVFETVANTLIVKDAQGRELWRYLFPHRLDPGYHTDPQQPYRTTFAADVDGDGETEVVFAYYPARTPEDLGGRVQEVFCFSEDGKTVKWRFLPGRPVLKDNKGDEYFPPYFINNVKIVPGRRPKDARIVVSSNHHQEAPDQVAVLDGFGKLRGEYWHPGHLLSVGFADLDHDGKYELLLGGVNNGQHAATLLVFDPDQVSGTASDVADDGFRLGSLPAGTEKAVVFFPRTCLALEGPMRDPYNRVVQLTITPDRLHICVTAGVFTTDTRLLTYQLDYSLGVHAADPSIEFRQAHLDLERAGSLRHSLSADEQARLLGQVIVRRHEARQETKSAGQSPHEVPATRSRR